MHAERDALRPHLFQIVFERAETPLGVSARAAGLVPAPVRKVLIDADPDHFGINLAVGDGEPSPQLLAAVKRRRPDVDPSELVAADWPQLHRQLDAYIDAGLSKFVIRPAGRLEVTEFIDRFVTEVVPRQN